MRIVIPLIQVFGCAIVCLGIWMVYPPLAVVLAGIVLLVIGVVAELRREKADAGSRAA